MSTAISVEHLTKTYRLGSIGGGSLNEDLARLWAKVRGKPDPLMKIGATHTRKTGDLFLALDDVSFDVEEGQVLGIIGRNGAGKSTLLKILSQVTSPTSGRITMRGRMASLLEVGTGFHPDLTGRENIYLNGAILGMTKDEIRRNFDAIVDFSECEEFIDTPVKRYSSGMYVRLAFAVAAHLEPEILIVDEVLAVGDAQFQAKCLGKMSEASRGGKTVLFVSHNLAAIETLTKSCVYLVDGRVAHTGPTHEVVSAYAGDTAAVIEDGRISKNAPYRSARLTRLTTSSAAGVPKGTFAPSEPVTLRLDVEVIEPTALDIAVVVESQQDAPLFTSHLSDHDKDRAQVLPVGRYSFELRIAPAHFRVGHYKTSVALFKPRSYDTLQEVLHLPLFVVEGADPERRFPGPNDPRWGTLFFPFEWKQP